MLRTIAIVGVVVTVAAALVPVAGATGVFSYYRNGSLINGQIRGECGYECWTTWYRAGSGSGTDACQHNNWIPLGTYDVRLHDDHYAGSDIRGRVWYLSDYSCSNGVVRTELFVHSEETSDQGQDCPTGGDDPFCWEGPNDYYSNGCIKVARMPVTNGYSDLGRIDEFAHQWGISNVGVFS
jgi:hypothetical protein